MYASAFNLSKLSSEMWMVTIIILASIIRSNDEYVMCDVMWYYTELLMDRIKMEKFA